MARSRSRDSDTQKALWKWEEGMGITSKHFEDHSIDPQTRMSHGEFFRVWKSLSLTPEGPEFKTALQSYLTRFNAIVAASALKSRIIPDKIRQLTPDLVDQEPFPLISNAPTEALADFVSYGLPVPMSRLIRSDGNPLAKELDDLRRADRASSSSDRIYLTGWMAQVYTMCGDYSAARREYLSLAVQFSAPVNDFVASTRAKLEAAYLAFRSDNLADAAADIENLSKQPRLEALDCQLFADLKIAEMVFSSLISKRMRNTNHIEGQNPSPFSPESLDRLGICDLRRRSSARQAMALYLEVYNEGSLASQIRLLSEALDAEWCSEKRIAGDNIQVIEIMERLFDLLLADRLTAKYGIYVLFIASKLFAPSTERAVKVIARTAQAFEDYLNLAETSETEWSVSKAELSETHPALSDIMTKIDNDTLPVFGSSLTRPVNREVVINWYRAALEDALNGRHFSLAKRIQDSLQQFH